MRQQGAHSGAVGSEPSAGATQQSLDGETEAAQLDASTEPATPVEPAGSLAKENVRAASRFFHSLPPARIEHRCPVSRLGNIVYECATFVSNLMSSQKRIGLGDQVKTATTV